MSVLEDQIRECFGRVVYTQKTHEKMADICSGRLSCIKLLQIALNGATAVGAVSILFGDDKELFALVTAVVSFLNFTLAAYLKGFDLGATSQRHADTASKLWDIRESYLSLLTDIRGEAVTAEKAIERRDSLQKTLTKIYQNAPRTNAKAYKQAQTALKTEEELTFSSAEIDAFVPDSLKKLRS